MYSTSMRRFDVWVAVWRAGSAGIGLDDHRPAAGAGVRRLLAIVALRLSQNIRVDSRSRADGCWLRHDRPDPARVRLPPVTPQGLCKVPPESCVHLAMRKVHRTTRVRQMERPVGCVVSGQWRAMPDGIDGIYGNVGNVVSVTYRF